MEMYGDVAERYRAFADEAGDSPCFVDWALGVAADTGLRHWFDDLPRAKQQPNLVFAAARWHGCPAPAPYRVLRRVLLEREAEVKATILSRATQTNEVGRLATLAPALAEVERRHGGPLALVEAGASAGLCLFPDAYDYAWPPYGGLSGSGGPVLTARASGPLPVPGRHPGVSWRAGVDLNPLDVTDADATAWLETLVWPEQDERRERLRSAVAVAAQDPPRIDRGDLLDRVPDLVAEAGRHGTPVLMHSAVVAYLGRAERARFHVLMTDLVGSGRCHWLSNEGPRVLPVLTSTAPAAMQGAVAGGGAFVLALDGVAVARTHGHGRSIHWW